MYLAEIIRQDGVKSELKKITENDINAIIYSK